MKTLRPFLLCGLGYVGLSLAALAQPQPPQPGPEHARLKQLEGTWDAVVQFGPNQSKGTMTYKMDLNGLWLAGQFRDAEQKFEGRSLDTYDPVRKKYISIWIDSMATAPLVAEGSIDSTGKVLTMVGEGPGMDGKPTRYKLVTEMKDKDTMVFTLSGPGKDGKDAIMLTVTYKRRK